jgi:hypothetical protein
MKHNPIIWVVLLISLLGVGCNAYGPKPTPEQTSTPKAPEIPQATVGPLNPITIEDSNLSMLTPSTWKEPAVLNNNSYVLSINGSTDTSATAGPFLYVVTDALTTFQKQLTIGTGFTTPTEQLNALMEAINRSGPKFSKANPYLGAQYPGAIVHGYERGNELVIVLLNAGEKGWIYIGAQAPEQYFQYYDETVFTPAINSIALH